MKKLICMILSLLLCVAVLSGCIDGLELPAQPTETTEPTETAEATQAPELTGTTEATEETQMETQSQQEHTHQWVEDESKSKKPTCNWEGYRYMVCSGCGETYQEVLEKTVHNIVYGFLEEPTCTEYGRQASHCTICGAGFINEFPATGHTWSDFQYVNGRCHQRTCSVCGAEETGDHAFSGGSVTCTICGADVVN